ncbi:hypothetical protein LUZ60_000562 [Juncus effusus]|nr:hypothetical protein LUZ60_000562 [Juncus effusus]
MGNEGAATATAKPDKTPPPTNNKEQAPIYPYPDWAAMQAYYGPGMIPPPYYSTGVAPPGHAPHPYMWGPQPMMPPFGAHYAVYPHAHPFAGHPASGTSEKENKNGVKHQKEVNGLAVSDNSIKSRSSEYNSADGSDDAINKSEENGSQKRKQNSSGDPISESKKKMKGETSGSSKATSAGEFTPKPLAALAPPFCSAPVSNCSANSASRNGVSDLWFKDEREMKREKRKQSNRESARRSRLRKQAETEELAVKVDSLTTENNTLRSEINRLTEDSDKLRVENSALLEKLSKIRPGQAIQAGVVVENFLSMIDKQKETLENVGSSLQTLSDENNNDDNNGEINNNVGGKIHQLLDPVAAN